MSKEKNNTLLYVGLAAVGYLLLTKKSATITPVATALPGNTGLTAALPAASTNPITLLGNSIASLIKGASGSSSSTSIAPVVTSVNPVTTDATNYLNIPPLQSAPLTDYTIPYNPFSTSTPTDLTGANTPCDNCFEDDDNSISGIGIGLVQPLSMSSVNPGTSVPDIIQSLVNTPVLPLVNPVNPVINDYNSIKFSMPYDGNNYDCCCNKGSITASLVMEEI